VPEIVDIWRDEVAVGRQDSAPSIERMQSRLARFDWDTRSRVLVHDGHLDGAVLVTARPSPDGLIADLYAAGRGAAYAEVAGWGVHFARATGAAIIHTMAAKGRGDGLLELGLKPVRPWWRMDRLLDGGVPAVEPVLGYELIDAADAPPGAWADTFNRSFADHWRSAPRSEAEIVAGKSAELCLMAVTSANRRPAAIALGEVDRLTGDPRPQPIGLISSVGTVPAHRRRGLAGWLVAEELRRLRDARVRHVSLYVDGLNAQRAYDVYRRLGFEVVYEAEVWEATVP
jgi:ribosomal protein S18 acetylase RimI-like enzyme